VGETIAFYVIAAFTLISALMVVTKENLFHCAAFLAAVFSGVAGVFVLTGAEFLAAVQVLIYVGAVTVIIVFAIMLSEELAGRRIVLVSRNQALGLLAALGFAAAVVGLTLVNVDAFQQVTQPQLPGPLSKALLEAEGNTTAFGSLLLTKFIVPFEFASVLLLVALVGAIVIAKRAE